MEITSGVAELSIAVDRGALARYGLNVTDVEEAVASGGSGEIISEVIDGQKRYTVALRLPERYRTDPGCHAQDHAARSRRANRSRSTRSRSVEVQRGPELINREEGQRRIVVMSNVRGRDLGSFVAEVRSRIDRDVALPPGYFIEYGGQFENQERATRRLMLIVPIAIALIFVLLYLTFAVREAGAAGGRERSVRAGRRNRGAVDSRDESQSLGFDRLHRAVRGGHAERRRAGEFDQSNAEIAGYVFTEAVLAGARRRLRPVLMTAFVASFGFIPMAISTSTGAEVQRPLASVVIGGLFSVHDAYAVSPAGTL